MTTPSKLDSCLHARAPKHNKQQGFDDASLYALSAADARISCDDATTEGDLLYKADGGNMYMCNMSQLTNKAEPASFP
jgi:hypothetical protein